MIKHVEKQEHKSISKSQVVRVACHFNTTVRQCSRIRILRFFQISKKKHDFLRFLTGHLKKRKKSLAKI